MKFLRENNARTRYLSLEECKRLIASCIAPHIRALVTVALHSGMRLGEILNLCWYDLDFASGFILVRTRRILTRGTCPWMRPWPHSSELILTDRAQTCLL